MCTIFKNFSDPFILFQEHRPSHLIKKNFIQTRNRKNKKVQGGCDEEQNVGDVDLNNVLHTDWFYKIIPLCYSSSSARWKRGFFFEEKIFYFGFISFPS